MAQATYIDTLLGGLDSLTRKILSAIFTYVLDNLRIGHADDQTRAENLQGYFYDATTPSVANQEFAVAHALGVAPYLVGQPLRLEAGRQMVPLTCSRAPDATAVYLKSPTTSAPITIYLEG